MVSYLLSSPMDITVERAKDLYREPVSRPIMCKLFKHKTLFNNKIWKLQQLFISLFWLQCFLKTDNSVENLYICFYNKFTFSVHKKIRRRFYIAANMFI